MSILDICDGIQTRLATISGLSAYSELPDTVTTPGAWVDLQSEDWHQTLGGSGGLATARIDVVLMLSRAPGLRQALRTAQEYLAKSGAKSIRAAIEADPTLGGHASSLQVTGWSDLGEMDANDEQLLSARIHVEVVYD